MHIQQLRARREISLQKDYLGNTAIPPVKYLLTRQARLDKIEKKLESREGILGAIETGNVSQSLVATMNTKRPVRWARL